MEERERTFTFRIPEDQLSRLRMIAIKEDRSVGSLVRLMIEEGLEERLGPANE